MPPPHRTRSYSDTAEDAAQTALPPMRLVTVDGAAAAGAAGNGVSDGDGDAVGTGSAADGCIAWAVASLWG